MTLRHMKIIVAVFQQGSVTKAAESLHMAQPSVSLALRELEDYYGVELFARVGRRLSPTECGRAFYGYALHIVSVFDEMETKMRNWDALGTIRIGATVTIGTYLLPPLIRQYRAEYPQLQLDIKVFRASQVEQMTLNNEIDLGLIEARPESRELSAIPFLQDTLCAIVPRGSALAGQPSVTLEELSAFPFLMREPGSSTRTILDAYFALHNLTVHPAWESVSTQAIVQAVFQGLGVAVLPQRLVARDVQEHTVAMLPFREPLNRTLYIVHHRRKFLSPSMQRFIALCQAEAPRYK